MIKWLLADSKPNYLGLTYFRMRKAVTEGWTIRPHHLSHHEPTVTFPVPYTGEIVLGGPPDPRNSGPSANEFVDILELRAL